MRSGGNSGCFRVRIFFFCRSSKMQISGRKRGCEQERSEGSGHCTIIKG